MAFRDMLDELYTRRNHIADGMSAVLRSIAASPKPVYVALRATPEPVFAAVRSRILATTRQVGLPYFQSAHEAVKTLGVVYRYCC